MRFFKNLHHIKWLSLRIMFVLSLTVSDSFAQDLLIPSTETNNTTITPPIVNWNDWNLVIVTLDKNFKPKKNLSFL